MTKDELETKITELKVAANGLNEPKKTLKLNVVARLKMDINGMALDDIVAKLGGIDLPTLQKMDSLIAKAKSATEAHNKRVEYFDQAVGMIKTAIGIVL